VPATATAQPTSEPAPSQPPSPTPVQLPSIEYNGVSFSYDPSLASQVLPENVPAVDYAEAPEWDLAPEHLSFQFVGYPLFPDAIHEPRIRVFPAQEYAALSPQAGQVIADLQTLLAQKPATLAPDQTLPFLPIWNAGQVLQANVAYLDFQNGNGVRFLSHYAQDVYPVSSRSLFYTFQGLTSDGRFYVSAVMPVSNAILPDENSVVVDQAFADNFSNYIAGLEQELSAAPASSFIPGLTLLDEMIASLLAK
jgi:hypothetical protein